MSSTINLPQLNLPSVTFKEAMAALRVSRSTVYRMMWSGQLAGKKIGATWRFYDTDLEALAVDYNVVNPARALA